MKDYIDCEAQKTVEDGIPLMRPLFIDFKDDKRVNEIADQLMFGFQILVAPIVIAKQFERKVYLPKGQTWIEFYTKEETIG